MVTATPFRRGAAPFGLSRQVLVLLDLCASCHCGVKVGLGYISLHVIGVIVSVDVT